MVSNLPISSKYRSQAGAPVDDVEREDLVDRLNQAFSAGTVSQDEYQALLDTVFSASTLGELLPVVEKLPVRSTFNQPAIVAQSSGPPPGQLTPAVTANKAALNIGAVAGIGVLTILVLLLLTVIF